MTTVAAAVAKIAARALFHRAGFLNDERASAEFGIVQCLLGSRGFVIVIELNETETAGAAGHLVRDHSRGADGAVLGEQLLKIVGSGSPRDTADKKFLSHFRPFLSLSAAAERRYSRAHLQLLFFSKKT